MSYLQTLGAVSGLLDRGLSHCREQNLDPEAIVETRVHPDMLPFRFQIQSVVHHSLGAIEGIRNGIFRPPANLPKDDYAALQSLVANANAALKQLTPEAINAYAGGEIIFELGGKRLPFTTETFLLSFSLPNFYFHATTAYDILRAAGVPLTKRDYLGALRMQV